MKPQIRIIILLAVILGVSVVIVPQFLRPGLTKVTRNGVSFSYPSTLEYQIEPSTLDAYYNYRFTRKDDRSLKKSSITISILHQARTTNTPHDIASFFGLTDQNTITVSTLKKHTGQKVSYVARKIEGDVYIPAVTNYEMYPGPNGLGPVVILYYRPTNGADLSRQWLSIRQTLKW